MIYLDYQATTPLAPEARAAMLPFLDAQFGNPHSPHRMGREAAAAVEAAREKVNGVLIKPHPFRGGVGVGAIHASQRSLMAPPPNPSPEGEGLLYFTSGATEAANWALKGALARSARRRMVTIATEHACVLDTARWLEAQGAELVILPVDRAGLVDLKAAHAAIDYRTALVAAMLVNNEIGVIQPITELSAMARAAGALFFCDAVQGFGRVPVPVDACDMIAISAHKVHGPKGIGALWLRDGVEIAPLLHGGGQEGGVRSGTLAPALCVGFGVAAELMARDDPGHVETLWDRARSGLPGWILNGAESPRWHGNLNLRHDGIDAARLVSELRDVAFSAGSACASGSGRPSHVLKALGLSDAQARASIRIGFGRYTTLDEIDRATALVREAVARQKVWAA